MTSSTQSVYAVFAPVYWLRDKNRTKGIRPTIDRITETYKKRISENKKPNFIECRSLAEIIGGVAGSIGLIGFLVSYFKEIESKLFKWTNSILTLLGLTALITGIAKNVNVPDLKTKETEESKKTEETKRVKVDRDNAIIALAEATIPFEMWEPTKHGRGGYSFKLDGKYFTVRTANQNDLQEWVNEQKRNYGNRFSIPRSEVLEVENFPHKLFVASINEHKIMILIPEIYCAKRPESVKRILDSVEEGLSAIPDSKLLHFYKLIRIHIGAHPHGGFYASGGEHGEVEIYHGCFNPSKSPDISENNKEDHIIELIVPDKRKLELGRNLITKNCLYHELGEIIIHHIWGNFNNIVIPSEIFPEQSLLRKKRLTIEKDNFAGRSKNNSRDSWEEIAKADGNNVSSYGGTVPGEDFCEAINGYMHAWIMDDLKYFQKLFPHRYAFLNYLLPQLKTDSRLELY